MENSTIREDMMKVPHDAQLVLINGKIIDIRNLRLEHVTTDNLSLALSKICRYAGRIPDFYSVAEHSIILANRFYHSCSRTPEAKILARYSLLHDGHEALTGDLIHPVKRNYMDDNKFKGLIACIDATILRAHGLFYPVPEEVEKEDHNLCYDEWLYFTGVGPNPGIRFIDHRVIRVMFNQLMGELI